MSSKMEAIKGKGSAAVLVGITGAHQPDHTTREYLDELRFLAKTLGVETREVFTQKVDRPNPRYFVGSGKAEEIADYVKEHAIDLVIFDDDLSPSQLRNLENLMECQIYDRSLLILEIFLERAQTSQARTQVELARYQYLMPRLTRMWTHLERQRGGTGTRGGAGEKEIETDRRNIRKQIGVLKRKLERIDRQNVTQRKSRGSMVRVALVGYTNAGKSTLMNLLTGSHSLAEDRLFATVDRTVRKVVLEGIPFLLSDTVGFIRKLPHHLIESFKSTLNEVVESDVLLHVIDVSNPAYPDHVQAVNQTLTELGAGDKRTILVLNKIDRLSSDESNQNVFSVPDEHGLYVAQCSVSAIRRTGVSELRARLLQEVKRVHYTIYPNAESLDTLSV
ncbi:MAG: GTPase HflX [Leptospiraceae bacterium]|nr:GTPase HflX [Leptospiraceae bacterium]